MTTRLPLRFFVAIGLALALIGTACSDDSGGDTTSTAPATTSSTTAADDTTTSSTPSEQPIPPPIDEVQFFGSISTEIPEGWQGTNYNQTAIGFLDGPLPLGYEIGWHWTLRHLSCDQGGTDATARVLIVEAGMQIPAEVTSPYCEWDIFFEQLGLGTEERGQVTTSDGSYRIDGQLDIRYTAQFSRGGEHYSVSNTADGTFEVEATISDFSGVASLPFGGPRPSEELSPAAAFPISGDPSPFPYPFSQDRAAEVVAWAEGREPFVPEIGVRDAPPSGLIVAWFACGARAAEQLENELTPESDDYARTLRRHEQCEAETAEARQAAEALGWELVVFPVSESNHGPERAQAYRDAVALGADVYFPRGFSVGGWSQADVDALLLGGAVIVENGHSGNPPAELDELEWDEYLRQEQTSHPNLVLAAWLFAEFGPEMVFAQTDVHTENDPRTYCGTCQFVRHAPGPLDEVAVALAGRDEIDAVAFEVGAPDTEVPPNVDLPGVLVGPFDSAAWMDREYGGIERPWYLFDLAIRSMSSDGVIKEPYPDLPRKLFTPESDPPQVSEQFRQAFLDAWGVG